MRIQVKQDWKDKIYNPVKVTKILRSILSEESEIDQDKEHFWVFGLTNSNVIKYIDLVSLGTLDKTMCEPREVFRLAVMKGVKAIIIAHNHPSGDTVPSNDDIQSSKMLIDAGNILKIKVLDNIIVSEDGYWSASEAGMI